MKFGVHRSSPLLVTLFLAVSGLSSPPASGQTITDDRGEAYYRYCLGRMYELEMQNEKALRMYQAAVKKDPGAPELHTAMAALYAKTNRIQKAIAAANRAIELEPESAEAHRLLGNIYFRLSRNQDKGGLTELAINEFKETLRLEPRDGDSRLGLAQLYLVRGEIDEAARELETHIEYRPESSYALYLLARVRRQQGELTEAADLLRRSIESEPRYQRARLLLATLYEELGRFDDAAAVYREALDLSPRDPGLLRQLATALAQAGRTEEAAREFERVLELVPDNPEAIFGLALVRRDLKQLGAAEDLLSRLVEEAPDHVAGRFALVGVLEDKREFSRVVTELERLLSMPQKAYSPERRAQFLAHLGFAQQRLGRPAAAVEAFRKARDVSNGDPRFETYLVQSYLAAEEYDKAAEACEAALKQAPDDTDLLRLRAQITAKSGSEDEGLEQLRSLVRSDPGDRELGRAFVGLLQEFGRYGEAEELLRARLADSSEAQSEELWFQLGAVLERQDKFDEAEEAFNEVLELNPKSAITLNYLGYMLAEQGIRLEESLAYVERAVELDPYNGAYLDSLGWVYFKMGRLDLAEENLLKAIERLRQTGVVYDHLGDLYHRKGDREKAIRFWKKALEEPDEELERERVLAKIEEAGVGGDSPR